MLTVNEIQSFIEQDKTSNKKKKAKEGLRYYEGEHKIMDSKLYYFDADGNLKEDTIRSNVKISHPFFTELVDQEVQYMLSGEENIIKSDNPTLQEQLDLYFDNAFWSETYELLSGCVSKGFDYMYAYQRADNRLGFQCADSMGVVEVRDKDTDDGCSYIIYWYIDRIEKGTKLIKRIQIWDDKQTWFYNQIDEGMPVIDNEIKFNPRPHIVSVNSKGEKFGSNLGFIPFFRLDNGSKQFSGLKPIKNLIDDYDLMACSLSNNLQDFTDAIYVVSGFQGHDMDELITNVKEKKHIGVDVGGSLDIKTVNIPYEARKVKLELDEKNIYRFGMGFNSAQLGDGNITNIVIKSRYALLDLKCNKLEIRLKEFLRKILKVVLNEINKTNKTDYQMKDVYFEFNREVMTNALDNAQIEKTQAETQQLQLNNIMNVATKLDDGTIIQSICGILDIDYEKIKGKIPENPQQSVQNVQSTLNNLVPESEGGEADEQKTN
ncbi:MAG: phage portal protein [Lachnotalea sp.]